MQGYGFYDVGLVGNENPAALGLTETRRSLASAGIGLRSRLTEWLGAGLELAKPLTHTPSAEADSSDPKAPRLYFSFVARF